MRAKLLLIGLLLTLPALAQVDNPCWIAGDAANLASELTKDSSKEKLQSALTYLKIGSDRCRDASAAADAWYYRALLEKYLGEATPERADRYLTRAKDGGSLASKEAWPLFGAKRAEPAAPLLAGAIREKFALVIGVGKFQSKGVPALNYTSKDARDFANVLIDPEVGRFKPENVTVLLDQDATLVKVRTAIGGIRQKAQREDLVVLYISSHGSPRSTDPGGVSYVVLHDTDVTGADSIYATGLAMSEIVSTLNRDVKAQRLVLFLDTCYSGAAAPGTIAPGSRALLPIGSTGAATLSPTLGELGAGGWVVVAASQGDQRSWESSELQQGYFTYFLLKELRASGGKTNMEALFQNVRNNVTTRVQADRNAAQTPVMSAAADGAKLVLGAQTGGR